MTTWFISRHPGAIDWARHQGLAVDVWLPHLDVNQVQAGDTVAGTLPIQLAARVCERGARYLHLSLDLPAELRGRELSAQDLVAASARLEAFLVAPGLRAAVDDDIDCCECLDGKGRRTSKAQRLERVRRSFLEQVTQVADRSLADELIQERRASAAE